MRQTAQDRAHAGQAVAAPKRAVLPAIGVFADNRPAAAAQRRFGELAARSPRQAAHAALGAAVDQGARMAVQRTQGAAIRASNRTGLPAQLKAGIESLSGMAMDDVRVHYNSSAPAQLQALAFAQGSQIHLAPGQEQHLPHEAWHVVQQKQGRVAATLQAKGVGINDDPGLEHEADLMGAQAASYGAAAPLQTMTAAPGHAGAAQLRNDATAAHDAGCACPGCHGGPAFQLKRGFEGAAVVQREVTVTIADANGQQKLGTSGSEDNTRSSFAHWPTLAAEFLRVVQPHDMPELNEQGKETGGTYPRSAFMCAEPHALSLLLHHYNRIGHGLTAGFLGGLSFPALAVDQKTGKNIAPCPVCSQWVTAAAPMAVHTLNAVAMKNQLEIDAENEDSRRRDELAKLAEEEAKEKSLKKEARSAQELASEQKSKTIAALQASCNVEELYTLTQAHFPLTTKELKKERTAKIKGVTDAWLDGWIRSLATTICPVIRFHEQFDDGHQRDFAAWVGKQ